MALRLLRLGSRMAPVLRTAAKSRVEWSAPMRPSISAFRSNVTFYSSEASENPGKEYDPKIKQLVDDISKLTLVEVADLTALLKTTLNITDAPVAMGVMPAGMAGGSAADEPAAAAAEQTEFTVKLNSFDASKKVKVIKAVKEVMAPDMNLVAAKKFVETLPATLKADISKEQAEEIKKALEEVGAEVVVE